MSMRGFVTAAVVALGAFSQGAGAVVIYSQAPADGGDSYLSSLDALQQNADRFTLADDVVLNTISWWGTDTDGSLDDFAVRIFSDDAGVPDASLFSSLTGSLSRTATAFADSTGAEIFRYDLSGDFSFLAGDYSLSIANDNGVSDWFWLTSASGDAQSYYRTIDDESWEISFGDFAFSLATNDPVNVPEPGSLALLAIGLIGLGAARRSRASRSHLTPN